MDHPSIIVQFDPPPEFWEPIQKGLRAFNESRIGPLPKSRAVVLRAHDEQGTVVGGAVGWLNIGWLFVDTLWVEESLRGTGLGTTLLRGLEAHALEQGIRRARLNTASFQARGFYEKHGYTVFAQLDMTFENAPGEKEQIDYFMRKDLKPTNEG
jgi:GNAT superfamily N-acetyltransferase